jgi:PadR family transcriptional regulator PadR
MRRGALEYCVLSLLRDEDRYAFELAKELVEAELVAGEGTLYPLLSRLRGERLVESFWEESPVGPPRRYYRITRQGDRVLHEFVDQWKTFRDAVDVVLGIRRRR